MLRLHGSDLVRNIFIVDPIIFITLPSSICHLVKAIAISKALLIDSPLCNL